MSEAICLTNEIAEGEARGFPHRGGKVVVVRRSGELFVYENRCPHFGVNLDFQPDKFMSYDDQYLQCAMHGALFEVETGACIAGPCRGQPLTPVEFSIADDKLLLDPNFVPNETTRTINKPPVTNQETPG